MSRKMGVERKREKRQKGRPSHIRPTEGREKKKKTADMVTTHLLAANLFLLFVSSVDGRENRKNANRVAVES